MSINAVLFDLDGTLLPMDQDIFYKHYFKLLAKKLYQFGYTDPNMLVNVVKGGVDAVSKNDGSRLNETVFWDFFGKYYGNDKNKHVAILEEFYGNEFQQLKAVCGYDLLANETVCALKRKGLRLVVATKPIFPPSAIESRIRWAGLDISDFEFYTDYSSCHYCKPDVRYYTEIAERLGLPPEECLMVGNDVSDDLPAEQAGMQVFLLTECLINNDNVDISGYNRGDFFALTKYIFS